MAPELKGFDHIHVYVADRARAEDWYAEVLGFRRVEALMSWAVKDGPLTLEDPEGTVHLALFERADPEGSSTVAFGASGEAFLAWKAHLEDKGLDLRIADHKLAYSLYFHDPDRNLYEITTYDYDKVRSKGGKAGA